MAILRKPQKTVDAIIGHYEDGGGDSRRPHLGGSMIGDECSRKLWYIFRWLKTIKHEGRLLKLFQRGHDEEHVFVRELRAVGVQVLEIDPDTNKQWSISEARDHFGGSFDGVGLGILEAPETWHLLEFKTHGDKSFKDLVKKTVQGSKPQHFAQMQIYMHLGGLDRAFYMAVNKNNDELYSERIKLDKKFAESLIKKAENIIDAPEPPTAPYAEDFYICRWCDFKEQCHKSAFAERNCRTCMYSTPVEGKLWSCGKHNKNISVKEQRKHHSCHRFIPALVPFKQTDGDGDDVIYGDWKDNGKITENEN